MFLAGSQSAMLFVIICKTANIEERFICDIPQGAKRQAANLKAVDLTLLISTHITDSLHLDPKTSIAASRLPKKIKLQSDSKSE